MSARIDLTGQRFGRLYVVKLLRVDKKTRAGIWACECSCGNKAEVESSNLRSGATKSCGCYNRECGHKRKKELGGNRFGRLMVINDVGQNSYGNFLWRCKCDCGAVTVVTSGNLVRGLSRSCGCLRLELHKKRIEPLKKYSTSNEKYAAESKELRTYYVRKMLAQQLKVSGGEIPMPMIEAKRAHVRVKRLIKEFRK